METAPPDNRRNALTGIALIVLGAIGFSAKAVLVKLAYQDSPQVDAITLMTLRMLIALPFFLAMALWGRKKNAGERHGSDWAALVLLGLTGYYLASFLDFKGLEYISAGLERLILFLYPTIVVFLTALLYRRPIGGLRLLALALSYLGIALVYGGTPHPNSPNLHLGALLVFGSAVAFAFYMVGSGHFIPRFGARRYTGYAMSLACLATIVQFLVSRPVEQLAVSGKVWFLALLIALISTVAPAFLMNAGIRRIGADQAAIVATVGPVSTLALAYVLLGETLAPVQLLGSGLVLGGVVLVGLARKATAPSLQTGEART